MSVLFYYEYFNDPLDPATGSTDLTATGLVNARLNASGQSFLRRPVYCGLVFNKPLPAGDNSTSCDGGAPTVAVGSGGPRSKGTTATIPLAINPNYWYTSAKVQYQDVTGAVTSGQPVIEPNGHPPDTDFANVAAVDGPTITALADLTKTDDVNVKVTALHACDKTYPDVIYEWQAVAQNYQITNYLDGNSPPILGNGLVLNTDREARYTVAGNPSADYNYHKASGYFYLACLPKVTTNTVAAKNGTSAVVGLTVTPRGVSGTDDTVDIEYGTDTTYGQSTPAISVPVAFAAKTIAVSINNLQPCTTYHYQAVATNPDPNAGGTSYGGDQTFTTTCSNFNQYQLPTANASASAIAEGSDGAMWFAENQLASVGRITTDGTITEYPTPSTNSSPWGITGGPDGDVWTAEQGDNQVAKIDPSQVVPGTPDGITEYPLPVGVSSTSGPSVIETGPDDALWFGAFADTGYVGRITTTGQVTTYPVPDGATPIAIAFGPNNTLWYIAEQGGFGPTELGSLNLSQATAGTSNGFTPTYSGLSTQLKGLALGPDGNIWVSDAGNNTIDMVTAQGAVTPYPIPTSGANPDGITAGPKGALWFSEASNGSIGEITTSGQITEYALPSGFGAPTYIASEPNGTLWFTEAFVNAIGSFTP